MGRISQKAKEKREVRRARKQQLSAAAGLVASANAIPDLMHSLSVFRSFNRNGVLASIEHKNFPDLSVSEFEQVFGLCRQNMEVLYRQCQWGWSDREKRDEMSESMAKYLLARSSDGEIIAFCHFRFDMDYDDEVLYCYEIQLAKQYQRSGLGRFLMAILELLAFRNGMLYCRLTCLKHNTAANAFFRSCGYTRDKTCLDDNLYETFCYEILSKKNPKKEDPNPGCV